MDHNYPLELIRNDFPILATEVRGKPLVYLDNAATTLKPATVGEAIHTHYLYKASNIHRGVYYLSEEATRNYEATRDKVKDFLNAKERSEIIFTSGTTASINLVAKTFGRKFVKADDEVLITHMEHHSNIVPWQMLRDEVGCTLKVAPINDDGELIVEKFLDLVSEKTKIVSMVYVSNSLGTVNPVKELIAQIRAKNPNVVVVVDAAQAVAHMPVDVQDLDCDFLAFSSHKIFGPTGTGVLYGRKGHLNVMPPLMGGGEMIRTVTFEKTTYADVPARFEAGTPDIGGVIGLGAAIDYVGKIGLPKIQAYEEDLLAYGTEALSTVPGLKMIGTAKNKAGVMGFTLDVVHPHDIGSVLDAHGVCVRAGHHCCQPVMQRYGVPATARASISMYNTRSDIDTLVKALCAVREMFL
jgi:cysteine desulfurase/selenocysteine lyase